MARRSDHSRQEIKQMALNAAIEVLNQEGVDGLSTRKVAKAIGYTAGTLYLVFKNLDELILHINAATLDELHRYIVAAADAHDEPRAALQNMALAYVKYAQQHTARWSLLYSHRLPAAQAVPRWFEDKVNAIFASVIEPLQRIRPDRPAHEIMQASRELWSGVHGACDLGMSGKLSFGVEFAMESLTTSLVNNYLLGFAAA